VKEQIFVFLKKLAMQLLSIKCYFFKVAFCRYLFASR